MRERMLQAPPWVLAVVSGTMFGSSWALWTHYGDGDSWTASLVPGVLLGLFFGAVVGPIQHRQQRGVREAAARSPEGLSRRVRRAAFRGAVPGEPAVREAAQGLALAQLTQLDRQRRWAPLFFLLMAIVSAVAATTGSPWWSLAVPVWTLAAAWHIWLRGHLRRRAALLGAENGSPIGDRAA